ARIGFRGGAVVLFSQGEFLMVVVQSSQVNVRGRVVWFQFKHPLVSSDGFGVEVWVFFQGNAAREQLRCALITGRRLRGWGSAGNDLLLVSKVHHKLPGNGFQQLSIVAEGDAMSGGVGSSLEQRVLHARYLPLHRFKRAPNHPRPHFSRTEVPYLLNLSEIGKRVGLGRGDQARTLPYCQLPRRDPQNS